MKDWEEFDKGVRDTMGVGVESLAYVVPIELEPLMLNLYIVAKEEDFGEERIEEKFKSLSIVDLFSNDFEKFDWVIYLPPRNAIDKALKEFLPTAMKAQKIGFFKRALVRGAVATFKPAIKDALEAQRKSILYGSILEATSDMSAGDIKALVAAYENALMPRGKIISGNKKERSYKAIREQIRKTRNMPKIHSSRLKKPSI